MPRGRSGNYRHYVNIKQDTSDDGDQTPVYSEFMSSLPANVVEVRGMEKFRGRQIEANVTHLIETRWYAGITPAMRVEWNGKTIDLTAVIDRQGRSRYLELHGNEVNG